jgi:serine/threonine protein phosphatase PrpC
MAFHLDIGFACQAGRKEKNEDFCAAMLPPAGLEDMGSIVALADGVSAGGLGAEAAQTTVNGLVRAYHDTPETWHTTVALDRLIGAHNSWLAGVNRNRQPAMGLCTLTALVLRGQSYTLAHVGDSRCYLRREGQMQQLTHDHVVNHPDLRHQLLRAVGLEDHLVVDYVQGELQVGDTFVLLSDGVHGVLAARRMGEAASQAADAQAAADQLLQLALAAGSSDNVSALVVRVHSLQDPNLQDAARAALSLPVPPKLPVGERFDGLEVLALAADNGIGLVYQVRDPGSQRCYALKTLHPSRAHDPDERAMLVHEAWLAKRMMSSRAAPHLVALHEHLPGGAPRSAFYVLYDWHGGSSLQQLLDQRKTWAPAQAVAVAMQTLRVLGLLHRQGVIHRDIKPANLHQGDDGVLRVLDLGVALSGREPASMRNLHAGTPSYVNPEQWGFNGRTSATSDARDGEPEAADAQSDLYALGVTLYQLLTGRLPYGEVLPYQLGRYHRDPTPPSRHNPEVPIWLDHVLQKAVALDKAQRFETAEEFVLALERGASRPLTVPPASPLLQRDPAMLWKLLLLVSGLLNILLVYWLVVLPK